MNRVVTGTLLALALVASSALAQQQPTPAQPAPPTAATLDPAADAKFKAADKNGNGVLDGGEVDAYKGKMTQIDANKDGKISREEFAAAAKAGHIR